MSEQWVPAYGDKRPREWWLVSGGEGFTWEAFEDHLQAVEESNEPVIHVIEKSAYDRVCVEAKRDYDDMRKFQMKFIEADQERDQLRAENERFREALERISKCFCYTCYEPQQISQEALKKLESGVESK